MRRRIKNQRRAATRMIGLAALLIFGGGGLLLFAGGPPPSPPVPIGGPIALIDGNHHLVTDADLRGRFSLIYFGYTDCPDICPTTLGQIAVAMDRLGAAASRVQPVFITVNPARDTPEIVARYTAAFSPHLLGLTGSPEAILAAERAYHVRAAASPDSKTPQNLDHSAVIYLMGPDGRLVAPIPADTPGPAIASDILRHLS